MANGRARKARPTAEATMSKRRLLIKTYLHRRRRSALSPM
jgi:hypothetical protein